MSENPQNINPTQNQMDPNVDPGVESTLSALSGLVDLNQIKNPAPQNQNPQNQNPANQNQNPGDQNTNQNNNPQNGQTQQFLFDPNAKPAENQDPNLDPQTQNQNTKTESSDGDSWFQQKTVEPVKINSPEELISTVNSRYGLELKTMEEIGNFFEQVDKFKENADNYSKVSSEFSQLKEALDRVPAPIARAIQVWTDGGDWESVFKSGSVTIDYKVPVANQPIQSLVERYFPGKFSADEFANPSEALQLAMDVAKQRYSLDQEQMSHQERVVRETQERALQARNQSVRASMQHLKTTFPGIGGTQMKRIENALSTEGGLVSLFYDESGRFVPEAAERVALALFGKEQLAIAQQRGANVAQTQQNLERAATMSEKPVISSKDQTAPNNNGIPAGYEHLFQGLVKKNVY